MIRFLFKQRQPRRFTFQPRFYDETKSYLEGREMAIRQELDAAFAEHGGNGLRSRMQQNWQRNNQRSRQAAKQSNKTIMLLIALLAAAAYLLLYSDFQLFP